MSHQDDVFVRTFIGVLAALIVIAFIAYVAAQVVVGTTGIYSDDSGRLAEIEERIRPVGRVAIEGEVQEQPPAVASATPVAAPAAPAEESDADRGARVYEQACVACHGMGVAGAPKTGDKGAWGARVSQGMDTLVSHAINGYQGAAGYMPARGGNAGLSDEEVAAAVQHMVNQSQ